MDQGLRHRFRNRLRKGGLPPDVTDQIGDGVCIQLMSPMTMDASLNQSINE